MKDSSSNIIYVGKAKNLKRRVRQYFDNSSDKGVKVRSMVENIDHFEYIMVDNEVESLILESNFIKENRPKYNVLMRDDKQYPYIKVTNERFPRLLKVRRVENDGASYFGPYPNAYAVNDTIEILQKIYKIRTCSLNLSKENNLNRPCLNYYIDRCQGPCVYEVDENEYDKNIKIVKDFLDGNEKPLRDILREKMKAASDKMNYETAALYRDYIKALDQVSEKQKITKTDRMDRDLIAMARGERNACVQVFFVRNGKIVDREHFIMRDDYHDPDREVFSAFLKQFYLDSSYIPKEILLDREPDDFESIKSYLEKKKGSRVYIRVPKRGDKSQSLRMVEENAREMLDKYENKFVKKSKSRQKAIEDLELIFGKEGSMRRVEAYDISNISGAQSVGSMVVFEEGKKASKEYRKFKIKTVDGPDDYASLREVLTRRFKRYELESEKGNISSGFGKLPSLIMMDGGKGQVNVCKEVLEEFSLKDKVLVSGLVKDENHKTRGIYYNEQEYRMPVNSPAYRLIYKIQEEAHNFAISYHKKLRSKALKESELDQIAGVGKARKRALLSHFKSISRIKRASIEEISSVSGISESLAENIYEYFHDDQEKIGVEKN